MSLIFLILFAMNAFGQDFSEFMEQNKNEDSLKGLNKEIFSQYLKIFKEIDTEQNGSLNMREFRTNIKIIFPDLED